MPVRLLGLVPCSLQLGVIPVEPIRHVVDLACEHGQFVLPVDMNRLPLRHLGCTGLLHIPNERQKPIQHEARLQTPHEDSRRSSRRQPGQVQNRPGSPFPAESCCEALPQSKPRQGFRKCRQKQTGLPPGPCQQSGSLLRATWQDPATVSDGPLPNEDHQAEPIRPAKSPNPRFAGSSRRPDHRPMRRVPWEGPSWLLVRIGRAATSMRPSESTRIPSWHPLSGRKCVSGSDCQERSAKPCGRVLGCSVSRSTHAVRTTPPAESRKMIALTPRETSVSEVRFSRTKSPLGAATNS